MMTDAILCVALAAFWLVLGVRSLQEKGRLWNNTYLYASQKERETMEKKPLYRQSGICFLLIAATFLMMAIDSVWHKDWMLPVEIGLAADVMIYAIVSSIRQVRGGKKNGTKAAG